MIEQVTGGRKLPLEVTEQIVDKTDGIPLFIEELTKTVLESGLLVEEQGGYHLDRPLPPLAIPATLQDSLMARLDRLAPVKETAQIGAAIGREFSYALLGMVLERNQAGLDAALVQLESAELISRRGAPPDAVYTFKHALVQDTAYQSLLKSRRQILHHRIAMTLLGNFPTIAETEPAMVAHHFTQAGQTEDAVEWWSNAGDQARRRFAFADAIAHLGKAIHLAGTLPDTPEWRLVRLRLQIAYANAHLHARGPGAVEPTAAFARAREIAVGTGDAPERFSAYYGLWVGHFARGELALAREVAEAPLRDILSRPNSSEASMVHRALGMTCYAEGNYVDARRHLEDSVAHYSSDNDRGMVWFGVDTAVATTVWLAIADWPLGEIDRACWLAEDMVLRAKQIGHVPTLVYAHSVICIFEAVRRASRQALIHSEATLVLAREHEMPLYLAIGTFFRGWAHSHIGDRETGLTEMREGLKLMGDQFPLQIPLVLELLAEEEAAGSLIDDALSLLDRALAAIERGHCAYSSEVHRSLGEILLRRDPVDIARVEGAFTRALEIARLQHTRTFELRAALSLARLYNATDRACGARELLESVVVGFDVRSELSELADARRLFEVQLARSA
jgi:tetratricopeptide (TPR) repeat protein